MFHEKSIVTFVSPQTSKLGENLMQRQTEPHNVKSSLNSNFRCLQIIITVIEGRCHGFRLVHFANSSNYTTLFGVERIVSDEITGKL